MERLTCLHEDTRVSGGGFDRQQLAFALGRAVPSGDEGQVLAEHLAAAADAPAVTFSRSVGGWRLIGAARTPVPRNTELPLELVPEEWLQRSEGGAWCGCSLLHGRRVVGRLLHRGGDVDAARVRAMADVAAPWIAARGPRRGGDTPWLPVAQVVHDLRRPLATFGIWLERLDRATPQLDRARRAFRQLTLLVDDLLAIGAPDEVARAPIAVGDLVAEVVAEEQPTASWSGVELRLQRRSEGLAEVQPRGVERAVANLIANAVEASPRGGAVDVMVDGDDREVRIVVQDQGAGVPPELRQRVLDPFFTTRPNGHGLGLTVVREVAQRHGGAVRFLDGDGCQVELRLPRQRGASLH